MIPFSSHQVHNPSGFPSLRAPRSATFPLSWSFLAVRSKYSAGGLGLWRQHELGRRRNNSWPKDDACSQNLEVCTLDAGRGFATTGMPHEIDDSNFWTLRGPRFQIPLGLPSGILRLARRRLGLGDVAVPHDLLRERDLDSRLLERLLQASVHLTFQTPLSPGLGFGL